MEQNATYLDEIGLMTLILQLGAGSSWDFSWWSILVAVVLYLVLPVLVPCGVGVMCGASMAGVTRAWGGWIGAGFGILGRVASWAISDWFAGQYASGCYPCDDWVYELRDALEDWILPVVFTLLAGSGTWGLCWWRNKRRGERIRRHS